MTGIDLARNLEAWSFEKQTGSPMQFHPGSSSSRGRAPVRLTRQEESSRQSEPSLLESPPTSLTLSEPVKEDMDPETGSSANNLLKRSMSAPARNHHSRTPSAASIGDAQWPSFGESIDRQVGSEVIDQSHDDIGHRPPVLDIPSTAHPNSMLISRTPPPSASESWSPHPPSLLSPGTDVPLSPQSASPVDSHSHPNSPISPHPSSYGGTSFEGNEIGWSFSPSAADHPSYFQGDQDSRLANPDWWIPQGEEPAEWADPNVDGSSQWWTRGVPPEDNPVSQEMGWSQGHSNTGQSASYSTYDDSWRMVCVFW